MKLALLIATAGLALFHAIVPASVRRESAAAGSVARAQFASAIKDRQPADSLTAASVDKTPLYFFTELKGLAGAKVTHRWEHAGKVEREQTFDVGADRWRAWSSKSQLVAGDWKVTVVDGSGATLGTYAITVGK